MLHDLNSAQGTYVNNCRVQNSAVRLAPGDVIKFGYNGRIYELLIDNNSKVNLQSLEPTPGLYLERF